MKITIGSEVDTDKKVVLDLDYAIEERMEILGGSGSGKSHLARCICEKANGKVQQIIISPKKEFVTLREKFDYVHVGTATEKQKPDIELNTRYAGQLALKILETGMDAIIEFSENPKERVKYVKNFIEGILEAPEHLWHPVMILIDEIDIWAPEKGHGEAESLGTIADLASRGRDKGFFLFAVTQRISKFNKDVAAELGIKFIGKATLDNDQTRAAQELGIPSKEKNKLRELGRPNFHFYAFGPGLSDDVIKIKSLDVQTTHVSGYKRNKMQKPIPTPAKIKSIISHFSDLPKEAEKELKTKRDMQQRIQDLQKEVNQMKRQQPKQDPQALERAYQKGWKECAIESKKKFDKKIMEIKQIYGNIIQNASEFPKTIDAIVRKDGADISLKPSNDYGIVIPPPKKTPEIKIEIDSDISLNKCAEACLKKLVEFNKPLTRRQIAVYAGYSPKSGGFSSAIKSLREQGLIEENGTITPTDRGIEICGGVDFAPQNHEDLLKHWKSKLGTCPAKLLEYLCSIYNDPINSLSRTKLAEATNYSPTSGGFSSGVKTLVDLGLATESQGEVRASEEMFP